MKKLILIILIIALTASLAVGLTACKEKTHTDTFTPTIPDIQSIMSKISSAKNLRFEITDNSDPDKAVTKDITITDYSDNEAHKKIVLYKGTTVENGVTTVLHYAAGSNEYQSASVYHFALFVDGVLTDFNYTTTPYLSDVLSYKDSSGAYTASSYIHGTVLGAHNEFTAKGVSTYKTKGDVLVDTVYTLTFSVADGGTEKKGTATITVVDDMVSELTLKVVGKFDISVKYTYLTDYAKMPTYDEFKAEFHPGQNPK